MPKFYGDCFVHAIVLCFVLLIPFLLSGPVMVFAESPPKGSVRSGSMTIEGKSNNAIVVGERHFIVAESTTILDLSEKKIQLSDLPVPCEARIEYQLRMDQDPLCLRIIVERLLEGSSKVWPLPGSEE